MGFVNCDNMMIVTHAFMVDSFFELCIMPVLCCAFHVRS